MYHIDFCVSYVGCCVPGDAVAMRNSICRSDPFNSIATAILPACPPSLFPFIAIELFLPKLDVYRVVCFTHPFAEIFPVADPWLVAVLHPCSEIVCADPAWIHLPKQA